MREAMGDIPKLNRSASKWRKGELELLGAEYKYKQFGAIGLGVEDGDMPAELLEGNIHVDDTANLVIDQ